jgi:hypothetical protein
MLTPPRNSKTQMVRRRSTQPLPGSSSLRACATSSAILLQMGRWPMGEQRSQWFYWLRQATRRAFNCDNDPGEAVSDSRLELAYDAAVKLLSVQDATLGNLRNRATGLLSVVALATTFSTGIGIINRDPTKGPIFPDWAAFLLLVILVAIGILSMVILWPIRGWAYGVDPRVILQKREQEKSEDEIRQEITLEVISALTRNQGGIELRSVCYRCGVGPSCNRSSRARSCVCIAVERRAT